MSDQRRVPREERERAEETLARTFRTPLDPLLTDATRLRIVAALVGLPDTGRLGFTTLRDLLQLTDGNLGMHLRVLTEADYVSGEREQPVRGHSRTLYAATAAGRAAFDLHARALREIIAASGQDPGPDR